MQIVTKTVRGLNIKDNGRSSDFIPPSFIYGCAAPCKTYCYVRRNNKEKVQVAENYKDILQSIDKHSQKLEWPKIPNQCDKEYYIYDIGCNNDISLYWKHQKWEEVFEFFKSHPKAKASFATKFVNLKMLDFNPINKVRIRFSLMPQNISDIVEKGISKVEDKLKSIELFQKTGYEVHLNFSPVIITPTWKEDYIELFKEVKKYTEKLSNLASEVIFLTHNQKLHEHNLLLYSKEEQLLWQPHLQENKISSYGGDNIRYKHYLKTKYIQEFKELYNQYIPNITIRYIF